MKKRSLFKLAAVLMLAVLVVGSLAGCGKSTTVAEDGTKLSDDSSDFVLISEAVPDAILEIRYYSTKLYVE